MHIYFPMASSRETRQKYSDLCVGTLQEMKSIQLPTVEDVLKHYLLIKIVENMPNRRCVNNISEYLAELVIEIWNLASIPCGNVRSVAKKITLWHTKYTTE